MDSVLRAALMYLLLLLVFRIAGKRTLAQISPFDMVLLLVIAESTQQALVGPDYSIVNAVVVIVTLVSIDIALSHWRRRSHRLARLMDDVPVILVDHGRPLTVRMDEERVDRADILAAARQQGLERLDQVKYAVLETSGEISIMAWERAAAARPEPGEMLGG
jgi:uncharacterized membrane protein YcaP (DUF421 family)